MAAIFDLRTATLAGGRPTVESVRSASRFARLRVLIDDPPRTLTGALVLDPHETVVETEVVADGVLPAGARVRVAFVLNSKGRSV